MAVSDTIKNFSGKAVDKLKTAGRENLLGDENATLFDGAIIEVGVFKGVEHIGNTDLSREDVAALTGTPVEKATLKEKMQEAVTGFLQPRQQASITLISHPTQAHIVAANNKDNVNAGKLNEVAKSAEMHNAIQGLKESYASQATAATKAQPSAKVSSGADLGMKTKQSPNGVGF